jgi:hypothetical protein
MKKGIFGICVLALVVLLAGVVYDDGSANTNDRAVRKGGKALENKDVVTIAGTVSGSLQGRIRVGARDVEITKQTRIYKTGKGSIDYGSIVRNAPVYIYGVKGEKGTYARLVIVSDSKERKDGGAVRKLDPNEPR